jgi:hypothetical protein
VSDQLKKSNHARKAVGNVILLIYIRVIVTPNIGVNLLLEERHTEM